MLWKNVACLVAILSTLAVAKSTTAEVTAENVRQSIKRAQRFLITQQRKARGNWKEYPGEPCGATALCTLALINSGMDTDDRVIQRAVEYLRGFEPERTYSTALQTMVLCLVDPDTDIILIRRNVRWLESAQLTRSGHVRRGAWSYTQDATARGDNSNSQFALLALHEAHQVGVEVNERTWRLALNYWLDAQRQDGGWGYVKQTPSRGSMTCAGVSSLIITMDKLPEFRQGSRVAAGRVICCGESDESRPYVALQSGIDWIGSFFSVSRNPSRARSPNPRGYLLYYLYGIERVGRLSGRRFFDRYDWYREGADFLLKHQDSLSGTWKFEHPEDDEIIATSLALLFLSKGSRPVVMAKYKYSTDQEWDLHRGGVPNLVASVERRWDQRLTWQTIAGSVATAEDLMEAPVLFLSGRGALNLSRDQRDSLRDYISQGGFIFAEACNGDGCKGATFDRQFRALIADLFPESELRPLPPDHPVWHAERKVVPDANRWLWGLDACCRTSVVYCPTNLSCYWELDEGLHEPTHAKDVQQKIDQCMAMGQNVLAYATNRRLKAKLDRPNVVAGDGASDGRDRGILVIPKLAHEGGSDDAPNALRNLLNVVGHELEMQNSLSLRTPIITPDDPNLFQHPILFIHGRREFLFSAAHRKALATYLQRGGFLFGDAICASSQFASSLRNELSAMFPDLALERIPIDHPLLSTDYRGYDLNRVTLRSPTSGGEGDPIRARLSQTEPYLEALTIDGRIAVVFSPYDLSCALENHASLECKGYTKADAAKIGLNVIIYALQQ